MNKPQAKIFQVLIFSIFTAVTGVGIVVPLLPVYARDNGASGFAIGMIFGIFSFARTTFIPGFGRASDRLGRKPFILGGLLGYALVSAAFLIATNVTLLIVIRFFQGIASAMMMPVLQAYVGDITPEGNEGKTMGYFNMATFMGLSLGPLLGGVICDRWSIQATFLSMGILSLVAFSSALWLLPPTREERSFRLGTTTIAWRHLIADRDILALFVIRMAYAACIGILWGFLPLYADEVYGLSRSAIGLLIMCGVMVSGLLHVPMGYLADRVSRRGMVVVGGLVAGLAVMVFTWAARFRSLIFISAVFGMGGGIAMPALMGLAVQKGAVTEAMGSVMALITLAHSLGMMLGALLAGSLMDWLQLKWVFPVGAGLMAIAVVIFAMLLRGGLPEAPPACGGR
jgi:DHA1 family multidrug resistance protein-like MFS transporter